jgi:hypothetical protein
MAALAAGALAAFGAQGAGGLPTRVGACVATRVKTVETRLEDGITHQPVADSGSAIEFANGGYQVSYDTLPAITRSRPGDAIRLCLRSIPSGCPRGDDRGREYRATNLRTGQSWELPDSEHMCGGA